MQGFHVCKTAQDVASARRFMACLRGWLYPYYAAGGTFALYSLIARYAHISTPSGGSPNSSDLHLSRYTSNSMIENSQRHRPKTVAERVCSPRSPPNAHPSQRGDQHDIEMMTRSSAQAQLN